jgi:CDP-6-deoxy-D-xylo-4-hexulose-3-dehydrase
MKNLKYPLLYKGFTDSDKKIAIDIVKSGQITMSKITQKFEKDFAKKIGSKYALMVNSGSSANLLAAFASTNPMRNNRFIPGQEFLIPAVCWPTSLWPFVQAGLKPVFVDIDLETLNINIDDLKKKITSKTKVIVLVHVLGLCSKLEEIRMICKKKKIILIEDSCEAFGSTYKGEFLGTLSDFGTYSFYYSHQITSGEGGMVVCQSKKDYEILLQLRAHGWTRDLPNRKSVEKKFLSHDKRFLFINSGFNLRATEIQAGIANNQLKNFEKKKVIRTFNKNLIHNKLINHKKWNNQFTIIQESKDVSPNWFGIPMIINKKLKKNREVFLEKLQKKGIDNRPIISGNFVKQPSFKLYKFKNHNYKNTLKNSQIIHERGFFIGVQNKKINNNLANYVVNQLLKI